MTRDEIRALLLEADALNTAPEVGQDPMYDLKRKADSLHKVLTALIAMASDLNEAWPPPRYVVGPSTEDA